MVGFFKLLGKGVLYTITSPLILAVWVLYGIYLIFAFLFMLIKSTILYFRGIDPTGDTPEDVESKRIILEAANEKAQMQQAMGAVFQNMSQQLMQQQMMQQAFQQQVMNQSYAQQDNTNVESQPEEKTQANYFGVEEEVNND